MSKGSKRRPDKENSYTDKYDEIDFSNRPKPTTLGVDLSSTPDKTIICDLEGGKPVNIREV